MVEHTWLSNVAKLATRENQLGNMDELFIRDGPLARVMLTIPGYREKDKFLPPIGRLSDGSGWPERRISMKVGPFLLEKADQRFPGSLAFLLVDLRWAVGNLHGNQLEFSEVLLRGQVTIVCSSEALNGW